MNGQNGCIHNAAQVPRKGSDNLRSYQHCSAAVYWRGEMKPTEVMGGHTCAWEINRRNKDVEWAETQRPILNHSARNVNQATAQTERGSGRRRDWDRDCTAITTMKTSHCGRREPCSVMRDRSRDVILQPGQSQASRQSAAAGQLLSDSHWSTTNWTNSSTQIIAVGL